MAAFDSLISYYKLDWNSNDATTSWYNGTDTSMSYTSTGAKNVQNAVFSWSWYITLWQPTNLDSLIYNTAWSISFWAKRTATGAWFYMMLAKDWGWGSQNTRRVYAQNSWWIWFDVWTDTSGSIATWYNDWNRHFIVVTNDWSSTCSLYVDNVSKWNGNRWTNNYSTPIIVWKRATWLAYTWSLDEIWFYNKVLDSTERSELWNSWNGKFYWTTDTDTSKFFLMF
jgi:hypothetical protein